MGQHGDNTGTNWPTGLDTASAEIDSPSASRTKARAAVPNDISAAVVAVQTDLRSGMWVYDATYTSLQLAITAAAGKTLILTKSWTLAANTTIGATVSLFPFQSGIINSGGHSLTINGPIVGNPMHQWLSGFAASEITIKGKIHVKWFGAQGDYSWATSTGTDDSTALQLACDIKGLMGGGDVDISGSLYKISQITMSYMHVRIMGDWVGFDYTNDGLVGDIDAQKPSCALVCNSGVYAIHIRYNTTGYGYYNILKDFALVSENDIEYGLVVSCAMSGTDNFMVTGFDYGITTFGQNSNLYNRTSVLNNNKIGFICSAPGTAKAIIAYQHPNLNTYIDANVVTSTLFSFNGVIRANKFGMVLMNGMDVRVDAVFEFNTMSAIVLFKQDGQDLNNIDFTHSWFEVNYANFLSVYAPSTYSVTGITPLKTSATEYLKGSVTDQWSNTGYDVGCDILIGSEIEKPYIHYTASTIAFVHNNPPSVPDTITDSANGFGNFRAGDKITVYGSGATPKNNGGYTIVTATAGTLTLLSTTTLTAEASGPSITIITLSPLMNRPYNIFFRKNIWGSNTSKGKAFYFRSAYKIFVEDCKFSNGDATDLFRGQAAYCNNIYLSDLTFAGDSALTFEVNFITSGNFCGEGYNIRIKIPETEILSNIGGYRIMSGNQPGDHANGAGTNGTWDFVPRMTTTEINNILSPNNGMIVYDTTLNKFQGYEAGAWANLI